jgi:hypothetical protein
MNTPKRSSRALMRLGWLITLVVGSASVVVAHFFFWAVLALGASNGECPQCQHETTAWTFLFWIPELMLAMGLVIGLGQRKPRTSFIWVTGAFITLLIIFVVYLSDLRRVWSVPVLPRF